MLINIQMKSKNNLFIQKMAIDKEVHCDFITMDFETQQMATLLDHFNNESTLRVISNCTSS